MEDILLFLKKYWKELLFAFFIILSIGISCYCLFRVLEDGGEKTVDFMANISEESKEEKEEEKEEAITQPVTIHVDIKGAVKTPGVYEVENGAIINDIITLAGGFKENAYQEGINLSKKVEDEMVIYIYTEEEMSKSEENIDPSLEASNHKTEASDKLTTCDTKSYNINDCIEKQESMIITEHNPNLETSENSGEEPTYQEEEEESTLININTASKSELTELSGIGEVKAQAIIDYRNTSGNFKSIEELLNVKGIGDATFEKIKDFITV